MLVVWINKSQDQAVSSTCKISSQLQLLLTRRKLIFQCSTQKAVLFFCLTMVFTWCASTCQLSKVLFTRTNEWNCGFVWQAVSFLTVFFFMECFCAKVPFCDSKRCISSAGSNACYVHIKISVARKAGKLTKAIRCNDSIEVRMMCIKPLILIWSMHL